MGNILDSSLAMAPALVVAKVLTSLMLTGRCAGNLMPSHL